MLRLLVTDELQTSCGVSGVDHLGFSHITFISRETYREHVQKVKNIQWATAVGVRIGRPEWRC